MKFSRAFAVAAIGIVALLGLMPVQTGTSREARA